jgi:hypothetical protein
VQATARTNSDVTIATMFRLRIIGILLIIIRLAILAQKNEVGTRRYDSLILWNYWSPLALYRA